MVPKYSLVVASFFVATPSLAATCNPTTNEELKEILVSSGEFVGKWTGTNNASGKSKIVFDDKNRMTNRFQGNGKWNTTRARYNITSPTTYSVGHGIGIDGERIVWNYTLNTDCSITGGGNYNNDPKLPVKYSLKPKR